MGRKMNELQLKYTKQVYVIFVFNGIAKFLAGNRPNQRQQHEPVEENEWKQVWAFFSWRG
jgi:hypothetical protein